MINLFSAFVIVIFFTLVYSLGHKIGYNKGNHDGFKEAMEVYEDYFSDIVKKGTGK